MTESPGELDADDRATYDWQLDVPGFGESGQERLKQSSVLIARVGGLGSLVAYELVAAGIGRLVLAHGGEVRRSDLNRQLLMSHGAIGQSRVETAAARLREYNPSVEIETVPENPNEGNARDLVGQVDLVVDAAPRFEERFALNRAVVELGRPMVECAMYELQAQITTIHPGQTPCLACLVPEPVEAWRRRFPVFGAVAGAVGCLAAMEAIKVIAGLGEPLFNVLLRYDLRTMQFRRTHIERRPDCPICG